MAVLVTTVLVHLVEHGHDSREQPGSTQGSGRSRRRNLAAGHLPQERPHRGIRGTVIARERRLREGTPGTRNLVAVVGKVRHSATLGDENGQMPSHRGRPAWLALATLAAVAINLRIVLTSLPPLTEEIQRETGWSNAEIGALTTIPVLCMGVFALIVPWAAKRFGRRRTVALALLILALAMVGRLAGSLPAVITVSAFLAGVGIALAMGLVPALVRAQVPDRVGLATAIWTGAMMLGAALGGALTVPLASALGSWEAALAVWSLPAVLGLVVWLRVEGLTDDPSEPPPTSAHLRTLPWRSRPAWALTAFICLNSLMFYTTVAWLAPSFVDRGWSEDDAGFLFGLYTAGQLAGAVLMPVVAQRSRARRSLFAVIVIAGVISLVALGLVDSTAALVWSAALGVTLGAGFAMALSLLSEFGADAHASARLTAMALSVTYVLAAAGPLTVGALLDAGWSWLALFTLVAVIGLGQLAAVPALRRGTVVR